MLVHLSISEVRKMNTFEHKQPLHILLHKQYVYYTRHIILDVIYLHQPQHTYSPTHTCLILIMQCLMILLLFSCLTRLLSLVVCCCMHAIECAVFYCVWTGIIILYKSLHLIWKSDHLDSVYTWYNVSQTIPFILSLPVRTKQISKKEDYQ